MTRYHEKVSHNFAVNRYFRAAAQNCPTGETVGRDQFGCPIRVSLLSRVVLCESNGDTQEVRGWEVIRAAKKAGWIKWLGFDHERHAPDTETHLKAFKAWHGPFTGFDMFEGSVEWLVPFDAANISDAPPAGWRPGGGFPGPLLDPVTLRDLGSVVFADSVIEETITENAYPADRW